MRDSADWVASEGGDVTGGTIPCGAPRPPPTMSTILALCPYVPFPATHGGGIRSLLLLQALAAEGDLHVAAAVASIEDRERLRALGRELGAEAHALPARPSPGAEAWRKLAAWCTGRSELLGRRWSPGAGAVVAKLCAELSPRLVVLDSSFVLPVWRGGTGARQLLHLHNLEYAALTRRGEGGLGARVTTTIERGRIRLAEAAAIAASACTVTVSAADQALALGLASNAHVVVVPNSIDLARTPLLSPAPTASPRLLFVGSFDYPPNLTAARELVDRHLPALRAAFPGAVVRLVGRDPAHALADLRGRDGVECIGPVDDLAPHYAASHAVYLPIRSGGGTRIKILEAWAFGRPVLSTAVGAEGLGRAGEHWLRVETPAQGVDALRTVVAGGAAAMVVAARELVVAEHGHEQARSAMRRHVCALLA